MLTRCTVQFIMGIYTVGAGGTWESATGVRQVYRVPFSCDPHCSAFPTRGPLCVFPSYSANAPYLDNYLVAGALSIWRNCGMLTRPSKHGRSASLRWCQGAPAPSPALCAAMSAAPVGLMMMMKLVLARPCPRLAVSLRAGGDDDEAGAGSSSPSAGCIAPRWR